MSDYNKVVDLLEQMVLGGRLGEETARQLVSAMLESFPDADDDDERFEDLMHILASYNPDGGEYLYDRSALVDEARRVPYLLREEGQRG